MKRSKTNSLASLLAVDGKAYWIDARTIEFNPNNDLTPDQLYTVSFKLGNVLKVPSKFNDFNFIINGFNR
jgi:alpha-2-macroglobulin